jgi:hypothetical protein
VVLVANQLCNRWDSTAQHRKVSDTYQHAFLPCLGVVKLVRCRLGLMYQHINCNTTPAHKHCNCLKKDSYTAASCTAGRCTIC